MTTTRRDRIKEPPKTLDELLDFFQHDYRIRSGITAWKELPAREAVTAPLPADLDPRLARALAERGITRLYSHQAEALGAVRRGESVTVVTPTASGKTLCFNLPVMERILREPGTRALYLFPTKALAQDQMHELHELITATGEDVKTFTYDGDTPDDARRAIRQMAHVVITNPDMLHSGILPHHTKWVRLFENLRYVVVDELHTYRGVFGSHVANVLRRLRRVARFYGADPQFICCSATIANPRELAEGLTGTAMTLIDQSGAPQGAKTVIFYNPPVRNRELGIRESYRKATERFGERFLENGISTIVFAMSRLNVEILTKYLQEKVRRLGKRVEGYRGGYLPNVRREIERGLREGKIDGVVSTNALELGVDIGSLDACVIAGYPGTIASTWQQAGRAGRRRGRSVVVLVARSMPLDQYVVEHPEYFFEATPEQGLINPDNLLILVSHLKCAAFELPFEEGEPFGDVPAEAVADALGFLEDHRVVHAAPNGLGKKVWHWSTDAYPANHVSLRSVGWDNFVVIDLETDHTIAEMDWRSTHTMLHEQAIYQH
ncbi:MAG: DEAD/DEAH box helicase, partial [Myxococcales bacterium]|nr:DEAD/DEAH box helicase [Myxococcales bacterium]